MSDVERYRRGPQTLISVPVATATVIEKGDHIVLVSGYAKLPSSIADAGDAAANREAAADAFIGIAQEPSANGETKPIAVDISLESIHELTLEAAAAVSVGDLIEIYATTLASSDDTCVAGATSPIAVCVEDKASSTSILAKLVPQKLINTPQA